jgi:hypothetical protein
MRFLIFVMISLIANPVAAEYYGTFFHNHDIVRYSDDELKLMVTHGDQNPPKIRVVKTIPLTTAKTGSPYKVDVEISGRQYRIETVEIFAGEWGSRGERIMAILINDVLYRPSLE